MYIGLSTIRLWSNHITAGAVGGAIVSWITGGGDSIVDGAGNSIVFFE